MLYEIEKKLQILKLEMLEPTNVAFFLVDTLVKTID